ncbi:MAG: WxcM-like domain-containing protein [Patescibacteria group bacterium]
MKIDKKPINFEDSRGSIRDIIVGQDVDSVTIITCKKGSVRGNHFHKKSSQYTYIVKGSFTYASKKDNNPVETIEVKEGDLTLSIPNEQHAFKALEDSVLLQLSKGPRQGENYENDTFRLEKPILE